MATWLAISPVGFYERPLLTSLISFGWLAGTFFLSPDTDGKSRAIYRYGWFKFIWNSYMRSHGHRSRHWQSLFSNWGYRGHWPIFGSLERIWYLLIRFAIFFAAIAITLVFHFQIDFPETAPSVDWRMIGAYAFFIWTGIEGSCCLHILCDYLPFTRYK